jgi:hypothetical protein
MMILKRHWQGIMMILMSTTFLSGCGATKGGEVSGVRSGIITTDQLSQTQRREVIRQSALLGVFLTEYASNRAKNDSVQGAIDGVTIQSTLVQSKEEDRTEDGGLLQAFSSALQVDVPDLLNRSSSREQALDTYSQALTNVAMRANERTKELSLALKDLQSIAKIKKNEENAAKKLVQAALKNKQFDTLHDLQNAASEAEVLALEATSKAKQVSDIVAILNEFLKIYGQKILAIQANREALIAGIQVVNIPGIDELKLIRKASSRETSNDPFVDAGLR